VVKEVWWFEVLIEVTFGSLGPACYHAAGAPAIYELRHGACYEHHPRRRSLDDSLSTPLPSPRPVYPFHIGLSQNHPSAHPIPRCHVRPRRHHSIASQTSSNNCIRTTCRPDTCAYFEVRRAISSLGQSPLSQWSREVMLCGERAS
jgi:hypothetical protein